MTLTMFLIYKKECMISCFGLYFMGYSSLLPGVIGYICEFYQESVVCFPTYFPGQVGRLAHPLTQHPYHLLYMSDPPQRGGSY